MNDKPSIADRILLGASMVLLVVLLGGCAYWKEYRYGHYYPAGNGALVDTNGNALVIGTPTVTPNHENMR